MATTQFELVTPTRTLYSGPAEMIVCRAVDGEIAFLANHMPYIGALDIGVVRIVGPAADAETGASSEPEVRLAVHGGFVEVKDNQVIMLADAAELASEVDVEAARRDESEAGPAAAASTEDNPDPEAEDALRWAQVRLEAASA
jgi:F-type H+-transporting ATPase subunit epsilon